VSLNGMVFFAFILDGCENCVSDLAWCCGEVTVALGSCVDKLKIQNGIGQNFK
jgi:hypothetical protein